MAFKLAVLATLLVAANAGLAPLAYSAPAHLAYHAPLSYAAPAAPVAYSAPAAHYGYAHYGYAAPAAHYAYAAPAAHYKYAAPAAHFAYTTPAVAKVAAPLAYAAPVAPLAYAAPAVAKVATPVLAKTVVAEEYDANPQYSYAYNIEDAITGDSKNQYETRNGDYVEGSYSLNDSDGSRRIVDYTADPLHGFNAVVRKEPLVAKFAAAPVAVAAPFAKIHHAF